MRYSLARIIRQTVDRTPKAKAVLMALAGYADAKGRAFPSQATLCRDTALSERSVRRALVELEQAGDIVREHRQRRDGSRTSDLITIIDRVAQADALASIRKLPLFAAVAGGRPAVDKPHEQPGAKSVDYGNPTGQADRLANRSR